MTPLIYLLEQTNGYMAVPLGMGFGEFLGNIKFNFPRCLRRSEFSSIIHPSISTSCVLRHGENHGKNLNCKSISVTLSFQKESAVYDKVFRFSLSL
ncbi:MULTISPECIES: hypothetical protein, partial [unclassified Candidatus Cardinium]|uniref:hypothetical protein n=1 Tax=unclassified Candidatus Cardinium TaxID=2641185 RepID=UPI001FB31ECB